MRCVLMSINKPHTTNINSRLKLCELRTRPPKLNEPFKVYTYETLKCGGCGKVVNEWICNSISEWPVKAGIPAHLPIFAQISKEEILAYSENGKKNIFELEISDLKVYKEPIDLNHFKRFFKGGDGTFEAPCNKLGFKCKYEDFDYQENVETCSFNYDDSECVYRYLHRPPQSWCYVEELKG